MKKNYSEDFNGEEKILKYKYKILIKKDGLKANQIKSELVKSRFFPPYEDRRLENPIYNFINYSFEKHFSFLGNSKAYLSNYKEREGSLEISFIILIICNYGGIRETMDYFSEDLENFFNSDNQFDISITYEDSSKSITKTPKMNNSNILVLEKKIQNLKRFMFLLLFFIILIGTYMLNLSDKITDKNGIEKIIDKKLDDNNLKIKIDYLYTNEVSKNNQSRR